MLLVILLSLASRALGHADMVIPPPRNAVDKDLAPWTGEVPSKWSHHVDTPLCPVSDNETSLSLRNGQSCFWFSHGCTIFCKECDGKTARGPLKSACGNEKEVKATICDPKLRTINTHAPCGSQEDYYYYNPWRAPGSAPVYDACGVAGGTPYGYPGSAGLYYKNTTHAKLGDHGSKVLPYAPSGTVWTAGELAEVSWTMRTNHGGGYQYRLCPKNSSLTEDCFQKTPLPFEGMSSLRWNGKQGKQLWFKGTYVSEGTLPVGSTWAKNPLPRVDASKYPNPGTNQDSFPAPCYEANPPPLGGYGGLCSGWYGPDNLEIVDAVRVPSHLPAGEYVVGWRYDCEESAQIWLNCADITIQAKSTTLV